MNLKLKYFLTLIFICTNSIAYCQNYLVYTPSSQTIDIDSGQERTVEVLVNCYGNNNQVMLLNPISCGPVDGIISTTYSNGTALYPGGSTIIRIKFKKTVTANTTVVYSFTKNGSCSTSSDKFTITVNYKYTTPSCALEGPTSITFSAVTTTSMTLNWSSVAGATSYLIDRRGGPQGTVNIPSASCCSYLFTNLTPGTNYNYTIYPKCSNGTLGSGLVSSAMTACLPSTTPTNLSAVQYNGAWAILFTPSINNYENYQMEFLDLTNSNSGVERIKYSAIPSTDNFFYLVPNNHAFQFRLKAITPCGVGVNSVWQTIAPSSCLSTNYPSNLSVISGCSYPGHVCGQANFQWSPVTGATLYEAEYLILNYTSQTPQPIIGTFQTTGTNPIKYNMYASSSLAPWRISFRVRSKCADGTWSDFSPWSANFAW